MQHTYVDVFIVELAWTLLGLVMWQPGCCSCCYKISQLEHAITMSFTCTLYPAFDHLRHAWHLVSLFIA